VEIVTITTEDLESIIRRVIREEMETLPNEIVSRKELRKRYGWSDTTVYRRIQEGMPSLKGGLFKINDIERWLHGDVQAIQRQTNNVKTS
jgi:hypothetical protein